MIFDETYTFNKEEGMCPNLYINNEYYISKPVHTMTDSYKYISYCYNSSQKLFVGNIYCKNTIINIIVMGKFISQIQFTFNNLNFINNIIITNCTKSQGSCNIC